MSLMTQSWLAQVSFFNMQSDFLATGIDRAVAPYDLAVLPGARSMFSLDMASLGAAAQLGVTGGMLHSLGHDAFDGSAGGWGGPPGFGEDTPVRVVEDTTDVGEDGNFTNQDINGLIWGKAWDTDELTFSFPAKAKFYGNGYSDPDVKDGFEVLSADHQAVVRYALDLISQYTGLSFTEVTESNSTHATLRFAGSSWPSTSYAYFPNDTDRAGDVWLGNIRDDFPVKAGYVFDTILHEIGHALGLKHGHDNHGGHGKLPPEHNSTEYSLMSYHSYIGADFYYRNWDGSGNQTYMVSDISALQYIYGANFDTNSGNTTYTWSTTTGETFIDGVGQEAPYTNTIYGTLWDGNGKDTYDLSNYTSDLDVDLRPGEWSTFSEDQVAYLDVEDTSVRAPGNLDNANLYNDDPRSLIENANGGTGADKITGNIAENTLNGNDGDDRLYGNEGKDTLNGGLGDDRLYGDDGKDNLYGGDGKDKLTGGGGQDTLNGGTGADRFIFAAVTESTGANYDVAEDADFAKDKWDVTVAVTGIDATVVEGRLSEATFDANLGNSVDSDALAAGHAVLFTPDRGNLAGRVFLIVDQDGVGGYQAALDLVVEVTGVKHIGDLGSGDFI